MAARDLERAQTFADEYGLPHAYGSYEDLYNDPDVDLIYIATPHNLHAQQAIDCMRHGKNVLVEKAFTANLPQAREVMDVADETGMLCTEAIWTRYMPSRLLVDDVMANGEIGEITAINADLCYPVTHKPRLIDPALAGGALLDVGVYPLNFIDMAMGAQELDNLVTSMMPYETGVDAQNVTTLYYKNGTAATAMSSMLCASDRAGVLYGTNGYAVCRNINNIEAIDVYNKQHELVRTIDVPAQLTGYEYEVAAAANAILDGRHECVEMTHADTLRMMALFDELRDKWGLVYPFERDGEDSAEGAAEAAAEQ